MLTKDDLVAIQNLQRQLQSVIIEKESLQLRLKEIEDALQELEKIKDDSETYRLYGDVLVQKKKEEIRKELQEEKENIEVRIKSLEKIENRLINSLKEYEKKLGEKSERGNETESS